MIKDQLRELRVRLDQMEQVALVIPTEYWPDAFDAVLQGWELRARPEKGLSGRALRDSEGLLKPAWNRDVDPSHSAAA